MDRRAKKLEKKRKQREQKRKATAIAAQHLSSPALLARTAAREPFGPCYVSSGWDDLVQPALVTVVVTRKLPRGQFATGTALVDRTCLGIKDGYLQLLTSARDLADFVDKVGQAHNGMVPCEPMIAQSIVYHAIDYARVLGFEPHPDFPALVFGPRPAELENTPWSAPERPYYVAGPHDEVPAITSRLTKSVGAGGFAFEDAYAYEGEDEDYSYENEDGDLMYSPLERTISSGDATFDIHIFRASTQDKWALEIEDDRGDSTVWEREFESDQDALDAALQAIEAESRRPGPEAHLTLSEVTTPDDSTVTPLDRDR